MILILSLLTNKTTNISIYFNKHKNLLFILQFYNIKIIFASSIDHNNSFL